MKHLSLLLFAALSSVSSQTTESQINSYDLNIIPQKDKFAGNLELTLDINRETETYFILKHGQNINFKSCTYAKTTSTLASPSTANCTKENQEDGTLKFTVSNPNDKKVTITYEGKYVPDGLFKETFNGKDYYFTHFANGGAEKVLLCGKKNPETFTMTIKDAKKNTVSKVDNIDSIKQGDKIVLEKFAGVFGTLIEGEKVNKFETYGVENPTLGSLTNKFQEDVLTKIGNDLLGMKFDGKMKQILLPRSTARDFNAKNLNSMSHRNFLLDAGMGASQEQSVRTALIQQLSQQWFGFDVIPTDKWLHTGVSTFLSYYLLDKTSPDEKTKNFLGLHQMVVDHLQHRAFEADGFVSAPALKDFNERTTTFDGVLLDPILYSKGASIVRSLLSICNDEGKFRNALKTYAGKRKVGAKVEDFAESFKDCFGGNVENAKKFLDAWHNNPGYPVVHVKTVNGSTGLFKLTQERFTWAESKTGKDAPFWILHIDYKTPKKTGSGGMDGKEKELAVGEACDWIILKGQSNGYFRVNYDVQLWNAIISQLENDHTKIDEIDRAQIIDDVFSFARSVRNYSQPIPDYNMAFRLLNYLKKETDYIPLKAAFNAFEFLDSALAGNAAQSHFRSRVKAIVENLYKKNNLTSDGTNPVHSLLIREVSSWACRLDPKNCMTVAKEYYRNMTILSNHKPLPNVEDIIFCTLVENNSEIMISMLANMKNEADLNRVQRYINGLGCSKDQTLLTSFIQMPFENPKMENYLFDVISSAVNGNPENVTAVLKTLKDKKGELSNEVKEKLVQLTLRKLNKATGEKLTAFVAEFLPESSRIRSEATDVAGTMKKWTEQKADTIDRLLTSGESRIKPVTLIVTLSAFLPFLNYFSRH